jgi:hypothetical protein
MRWKVLQKKDNLRQNAFSIDSPENKPEAGLEVF